MSQLERNLSNVVLDNESWGLICDAIEIAIGNSDYNRKKLNPDDRFWQMESIMEEIVKEIETQSCCQTKED